MPTARDRLNHDLVIRLADCAHDELRVLDKLLARLELGRKKYGPLDLGKARDWDREESEELLDARIYQACAELANADRINDIVENGAAHE